MVESVNALTLTVLQSDEVPNASIKKKQYTVSLSNNRLHNVSCDTLLNTKSYYRDWA